MTVRMGIGMGVALFGLTGLLFLDVAVHSTNKAVCMFYINEENTGDSVAVIVLMIILFVMAIGEMLIVIMSYEFVCAQSPYGMRGLIIGFFFFIHAAFVGVVCLVLVLFGLGFQHTCGEVAHFSCGTWYLLAVMILGVTGIAAYVGVARWYRCRQRGGQTDENLQTLLESYYAR